VLLFSSNPCRAAPKGWNEERYRIFHDWPTWRDWATGASFEELAHFRRASGLPIAQPPMASAWRRDY